MAEGQKCHRFQVSRCYARMVPPRFAGHQGFIMLDFPRHIYVEDADTSHNGNSRRHFGMYAVRQNAAMGRYLEYGSSRRWAR